MAEYVNRFSLKTENFNKHVPDTGESMGHALEKAAEQVAEYQLWLKAELLLMAASAYETAASASLGHNRAERYCAAARKCRDEARKLKLS